MTVSDWNPAERDEELHHISNVTKGVAAVAVGGTVLLGFGVAWGDSQRVDQANNREAAQQEQGTTNTTIQPPASTPTPNQPKSSTGGSGSSSGSSNSGTSSNSGSASSSGSSSTSGSSTSKSGGS